MKFRFYDQNIETESEINLQRVSNKKEIDLSEEKLNEEAKIQNSYSISPSLVIEFKKLEQNQAFYQNLIDNYNKKALLELPELGSVQALLKHQIGSDTNAFK